MLDMNIVIFYVHSLLSETLPTLRGDPYASSDDDETYQPSDDSESYDSDDSGDDADRTQ